MTHVNDDGSITASATISATLPTLYGIGFLGAMTEHPELANSARFTEIERRILRIEMALRRAGIEVEAIELPKVRP